MKTFTYNTPRCQRLFRDVPRVGCSCIDCRIMFRWRRIRRWLGKVFGGCIICGSPWHRAKTESPGAILTGTTGCRVHDPRQQKNVSTVGKSEQP